MKSFTAAAVLGAFAFASEENNMQQKFMEHNAKHGLSFTSQEEFSLYEQFNKGEKQNPLGPLFKVKPLDEENQPAYPLIARVIYFKQ